MANTIARTGFFLISQALLVACNGGRESSAAQVARTSDQAQVTVPATRRTAITEAVAKVAPSVVTVQTEVVQRVAADPFEQMFGGRSGTQTSAGLGS